ncbi:pentatricopeptide repeat-containing protein At4g18520, chloroplastic-like [Tasmannia lanceolata]|uniref:pentatricopeptide repeat-containing protein At4g18520, chloroplastic-like n=1 Tax=Tasmannia lanceolata TaxID=3420 RepID=UPI0040648D4E
MLAPSLLNIHQFHPLQISHNPSPPKEKPRNRTHKGIKKFLKNPILACQIPSISTQTENACNITVFPKNLDAKLSNPPSIEQFLHHNVLSSLLQSCSNGKEAKSIHTIIVKGLGRSVTFVDNNLIAAYLRFAELSSARQVFDKMSARDVVSWTAMLNGYLKIGLDKEGLMLFNDFVENCIQGNSRTFVCALNLCGRRMDIKLGEQIHACVVKGNWSNLIVNSVLLNFYAQCGNLTNSLRVFDGMSERDVVCWTTMITACAQQGLGQEAFSLFSRMQFDGICPNEFTVCSVLKACGEEKALKFGRQLHGAIVKRMIKDDVFIGSSLVGMYVKCGQVKDARIVFDKMTKRNTVTWTSMIAGYAQNGLGEEAMSLFRKMKRRRILVDNHTVVSILSACGLIGSLCLGKEIHAQILKNRIGSNVYIGSTLVWFYCKCGEYVYGARVLDGMPLRDVISWTSIISGYASLGHGSEALEFLNDMLWEGVEPNPFTYSSALKACSKLEAVSEGKWIHACANKTDGLSNVYVGSALINMYAKCGFLEDAVRVFDRMPERNLVSWKVMIIGYARNGLCKEALQLMYRMQAEGIKVDDFILTTVLSACGDVQWDFECSSAHFLQST